MDGGLRALIAISRQLHGRGPPGLTGSKSCVSTPPMHDIHGFTPTVPMPDRSVLLTGGSIHGDLHVT
jgi:hypothetical protein